MDGIISPTSNQNQKLIAEFNTSSVGDKCKFSRISKDVKSTLALTHSKQSKFLSNGRQKDNSVCYALR